MGKEKECNFGKIRGGLILKIVFFWGGVDYHHKKKEIIYEQIGVRKYMTNRGIISYHDFDSFEDLACQAVNCLKRS